MPNLVTESNPLFCSSYFKAFNEIEGNANNQAQESRWISLLRSDKYGQLIETPKFRKFAIDYIANQWRDLAIKGGYNHNSGMAHAIARDCNCNTGCAKCLIQHGCPDGNTALLKQMGLLLLDAIASTGA